MQQVWPCGHSEEACKDPMRNTKIRSCIVPLGSHTKIPHTGWYKQTKEFIFSQFWRIESSDQKVLIYLISGENSLPGLQAAVCKNRSSVISNSHSSAHSMCRAAFLAPLIWGLTVWSVFPNGVRKGRTQSSCVWFGVLLGRPVLLLCQEKHAQEATGQRMRYESTFESRHSPE